MKFQRTFEDAIVNGTSYMGEVIIAPKKLIETFGKPDRSDEYKVCMEYAFVAIKNPNIVFTIYDWKSTSLYEKGYMSPEKFKNLETVYNFHIGGFSTDYIEEFKHWVLQCCKANPKNVLVSADSVINQIKETLAEASPLFIQDIANKVLTHKVKFLNGSFFQNIY